VTVKQIERVERRSAGGIKIGRRAINLPQGAKTLAEDGRKR